MKTQTRLLTRRYAVWISMLLTFLTAFAASAQIVFPQITGFTPGLGPPGTSVAITGANFTGALAVTFNGALAQFTVQSATRIVATVPLDATTGPIGVTGSSGFTTTTIQSFFVAPRIFDFDPLLGVPGTTVVIEGVNFQGVTNVTIAGKKASFSVPAETQIRAIVPTGSAIGPIRVTSPAGTAVSADDFTILGPEPLITSFSPPVVAPGGHVSIEGLNFAGVTAVKFNGINAASFFMTTETTIDAVVPSNGTTGPITVITRKGTNTTSVNLVVTKGPIITDFQPRSGLAGTEVLIEGINFPGTTAVKFNGVNASFFVTAETQIRAIVPKTATNGPITVISPLGTNVSLFPFIVSAKPVILDFSPDFGAPGTMVDISGVNFIGTTSVKFNGTNAMFTVVADTQINAIVPKTTTGPVSITTPQGTGTSVVNFIVTGFKPIITDFVPNAGLPGMQVTILGANFTGTTNVSFNGTNAVFAATADTQINAIIPFNATTGPISVANAAGVTVSSNKFFIMPTLANFSPTNGIAGTVVTIRGTNFTDTVDVRFNDISAAFTNISNNEVRAIVPPAATTGSISVTTPGGIVASTNFFFVQPSITSFSPLSGPPQTTVTIFGSGFTGATDVRFGAFSATFNINSSTQIQAQVPPLAVTGPIQVITPTGTATSTNNFVVAISSADIAISQTGSANPILVGQDVAYTVIVTNKGPQMAANVIVTNTLPANAAFVSVSVNNGSADRLGNIVRWALQPLQVGASGRMVLTLNALQPGTITNTASVTERDVDPNPSDNQTTLLTTVLAVTLAIEKTGTDQVSLSWPAAATNFALQSTLTLSPPINWQNVASPPVIQNGQKVVTLPSTNSPGSFFRLRKP